MSAVLGILFFGLIVWGSFEPTLHAIASGEYEGEGALRVPAWPARTIVLIGSALVVFSYALIGVSAAARLVYRPGGSRYAAANSYLEDVASCSAISI